MFKRRTRTLLGAALVPLAAAVSGIITDGASLSGQTFDYVVVGGGLAGMAVAGRLSEDAGVTVLVIEAGGDSRSDPDVYDSNRYGYAFGRPDLLWTWDTVEGKGLMGGRTLGGSTAINGMTYTRGQAVQYDSLAELLPGASAAEKARWSWDGMLAAMKKAEGFSAPNADQQSKGATSNPAYHGASGPVQVTFPSQMHGDQMKMFQQVMNINFSVPTSQDPAGGDAAVVSFFPNVRPWSPGVC
jgi:choline dehydrogenase-like flavoprotein